MDTKKTNLTPELKEIYDRVMNTSGGKAAATASITPPLPTSTSTSPVVPSAIPQPENTPPAPVMPGQSSTLPPMNGMPASPSLSMPPAPAMPAPMGMPPSPTMPGQASTLPPMNGMPSVDSTAEQALSSAPARPVSEGNTFSFSGTAHHPPQSPVVPGAAPVPGVAKSKSKISLPVLIVLGLVFIIVWGLFWAIIFGFIKR